MTRFLLAMGTLLFAMPALAQMKEGKVVYERTMQFQMRLQNVDPAVANNLPRSRTDRFELSFTPAKTLWESLPDMEEGEGGGGPGGGMFMRFGGDDYVYTNLETGVSVAKQELASKNYIVTDSLRKLAWKLTDETKPILNYKARKAVAQRIGTRFVMNMENGEMKRKEVADTASITAWFTTEIPVPAGPEFNGQLPGLILELEMNAGRMVYKAVEISPKVNAGNIKEPKGGKSITAADFALERNKMFEEMRRNMPRGGPGGGGQRIVIQGN
ncbi:GLPGLI family protein [Paracnuella aquatica]|uniref:GLPGLI family protein n=1 Tax=Paracnuella aquatica TaxID=2268757 RepID=UPI000DEF49F5|nr:GLPGLI family protein [Paracnuella aquatica]RPD50972.1 GLPGLI family protein [Paracnuella aquatica]